jgi:APA family basic amino acid/polyamine antiporter
MRSRRKELGFVAVISMVIGSQVGSGAFNLPAVLAPYRMAGLFGWLLAVPVAICLALVFSDLSSRITKNGGPHVYVSEAFGRTTGFFTSWSYWLVSWSSNSVLIVTIINYLTPMTGTLSTPQVLIIEAMILFFITLINLFGLRWSANIDIVLTALKITPLLVLPFLFFTAFDAYNFMNCTQSTNGAGLTSTIATTALLAFWGFIGIECATTPAKDIVNSKKTLPRAIVIGTVCAALIYILNITSIIGAIGFDKLESSPAAYSVAMETVFGHGGDILVSILIIVACIGTLDTWTLSSCRMAYGAYEDRLFPIYFGKTNRHGAPIIALILSAVGTIPFLVYEQISNGGLEALTDTMCSVFLYIYIMCCLAYFKMTFVWYGTVRERIRPWILSSLAMAGCLFELSQNIVTSFVVLAIFSLTGIPVFLKCRD